MSIGDLRFDSESHAQEELNAGLKLAVLLEGRFDLGVSGDAPLTVCGSSASLFLGRDRWRLDHRFEAGMTLRYLTLHLDASLIEDELEVDFNHRQPSHRSVEMFSTATPTAMAALVQQMLICPYAGVCRRLHLAGKGLELAALAVDRFLGAPDIIQAPLATPMELRRLYDVRDWLATHYCDPPSLPQLARRAGLNVRKLTAGFRRLFGKSIAEYLRDIRMEEGHRLLALGCSVTEAADMVGYTLPHFTVAFRRRYGVNPGRLAGRDPGRSSKI